jgi:hypothetical protein
MAALGTLVYDGEIMLPIVSIGLKDGKVYFGASSHFAGQVTIAEGSHDLRIYAPDMSLVFSTTVEFLETSTVRNGTMWIDQPVRID